jgi:hypothetical protein
MGSLCNKLPDEYTKEIEEAVGQWIGTLPLAYIVSYSRSFHSMKFIYIV